MRRIYLAAPFFNPEQIALVVKLEQLALLVPGIELYSPRVDGVLTTMTKEERDAAAIGIFRKNCQEVDKSDAILAVIDGRDQGVTWELGYGYARGKPIVTYTDQDFGLNVMLKGCAMAHVRGLLEARDVLQRLVAGKDLGGTATMHEVVT